jgi:hypothetical protein
MGVVMRYPVFTSRYSIGITFLSWSYHWLAGHDYSWNAKLGFCKIPEDPNTGINAHFFKKNYRGGINEWSTFLTDHKNNLENCSMYGGGPRIDNNTIESHQEYASCLTLASKTNPLIFVVESSSDPWYFLYKRHIYPDAEAVQSLSIDEVSSFNDLMLENFLKTYFNDSVQKIDNNVWDLRELIALNFEHFKVNGTYIKEIDRTIDHLYIDSKDLWYNGENCLQRIFRYLGKTIAIERLPSWRTAYQKWQSMQLKILQTNWYIPTIVDSIVNNYSLDLDFLNLNLIQEGVIQGHLIKDHNLNLKCYGLKKFPSNTRNLHSLLEENTHK